jgi:hypothetical protein
MTADDGENWNEWCLLEGISSVTDEQADNLHREAAQLGVNAWELSILEAIWYSFGQVKSKELLADRAFGTFAARDPKKANAAIESCFGKSLIHFLTADFLQGMKDELRSGRYLMPRGLIGSGSEIHGFSDEGRISFTRTGASLFQEWIGFDPKHEHWAIGVDCDGAPAIYGTSIYACQMPGCWPFEPAVAVGPWCDRWWTRFESGFRMLYSEDSPPPQS